MKQFKYKAINKKGKVIRARMYANNELELEQRIGQQSQELINCSECKTRTIRFYRRKLNRENIINFVVQLEQLTKSGVPLLDGLQDLRDSADESYYKDVLASIVTSIEGGKTFSEALKEFPNDFDTVFIALISIGEESGELPKILKDMGEALKWIDELVSSTVRIIIYPAIVTTVVLLVTAFLMVYLVPKIIPFVTEMGGEIPLHTAALIAVSDFFVNYWWLIITVPIAAVALVKYMAKRSPKFKFHLDSFKFKIPLVGEILFKIRVARLANYLALLYSSGITVLRALEITKFLMNNALLEYAVDKVRKNISDGSGLSDSFAMANVFPPLVVRMVRVGENTGNLDESLLNVSYFYNREVQEAIDKIEPAITPLLTVIMGLLLGWIMLSVLGPIYNTIGSIGL